MGHCETAIAPCFAFAYAGFHVFRCDVISGRYMSLTTVHTKFTTTMLLT